MSSLIFPENFIWGVSASAYQIEGGYKSGGKGKSIWDTFSHIPGKIHNNDNADVACDHYHLYENDVKLLKELGVKSYRLSVSWPRIFPNGSGKPNKKGIEFYRKLITLLNDNGITPAVTIYHWDLPQKLQDRGGWAASETVEHYVEYASYLFRELGDAVPIWITFNEPWVISFIGNWYAGHPPGIRDLSTALKVAHNILLAHGMAVRKFRESGKKGEIGISLNLNPVYPASEDEKDIEAAGRYADFYNGWFLEPLFKGNYPEKLLKLFGEHTVLPEIKDEDMKLISVGIDFLGVNNYSITTVHHNSEKPPLYAGFADTGKPKTDSDWEIYPAGLYDLLSSLQTRCNGIKMIITENGAAFKDAVDDNGSVNDTERILYLQDHLKEVHRAIKSGVNLSGYYVWTFMDNFEWKMGYSNRFGLVYVDRSTQKRIIKKSGYWFKEVIRNNGLFIGGLK